MIKHIVMWKLRQGTDKGAASAGIKQSLESLAGKIDGLVSITVGENFSGGYYDLCLVSEHTDRASLGVYAGHPLHIEAKEHMQPFIESRESCDFEF